MCSLHKAFSQHEAIPATNNESKGITIHSTLPQIQVTHNIKSEPVTLKAPLPVLPIFQ